MLSRMAVFSAPPPHRGRRVTVLPDYLFHVTPRHNMLGIERTAVIDCRLRFVTRTVPDNWFVAEHLLGWAIAHTSNRHHVPISDIFVYRVPSPGDAIKFFDRGLYRVPSPVTISPDELPISAVSALGYLIRLDDEDGDDYWNFTGWASEERLRGIS